MLYIKIKENNFKNLPSKIQENKDVLFGCRDAINITFYNENNEFIDKIDTLQFSNTKLVKGLFKDKLLIDCKTQIFHSNFIKYILNNNKHRGKSLIEIFLRNCNGKDFILRILIDKLRLKQYSVNFDEENGVYATYFTLQLNDINKIDYDLKEYTFDIVRE